MPRGSRQGRRKLDGIHRPPNLPAGGGLAFDIGQSHEVRRQHDGCEEGSLGDLASGRAQLGKLLGPLHTPDDRRKTQRMCQVDHRSHDRGVLGVVAKPSTKERSILRMPRKDGREVLAELKKDPDLRRIPVVVLTTSTSDEDITESYDLRSNCYV